MANDVISRRDLLRLGGGVAASVMLAGLGSALAPRLAFAEAYKFDDEPYGINSGVTSSGVSRYFPGNPSGSVFYNELLGLTAEQIVGELKAHEHDGKYLGVPYGGDPDMGIDICAGLVDNPGLGRPGMQCNGFVARVFYELGVNKSYLAAYWLGVVSTMGYLRGNGVCYYRFHNVDELLAARVLKPGDIIMFQTPTAPFSAGAVDKYGNPYDAHIGFYWGDPDASDISGVDRFWHSAHGVKGVRGGTVANSPAANAITKVFGKNDDTNCVWGFPLSPSVGHITVSKTSSARL